MRDGTLLPPGLAEQVDDGLGARVAGQELAADDFHVGSPVVFGTVSDGSESPVFRSPRTTCPRMYDAISPAVLGARRTGPAGSRWGRTRPSSAEPAALEGGPARPGRPGGPAG